MASRRNRWALRAGVSAALALGLHLLGVGLFWLLGGWGPVVPLSPAPGRAGAAAASRPATDAESPLEVETLVDQLDRPETKSAAEAARDEAKQREEESKDPKGQVVDLPRPAIEQRPEHARFVAEHDSKVDKETRGPKARDQAGARTEVPEGRPDPSAPAAPGGPPPGEAQTPRSPGKLALSTPGRPTRLTPPTPQTAGEEGTPLPEDDEAVGRRAHRGEAPRGAAPPVDASGRTAPPGEAGAGQDGEAGRGAQQPGLPGGKPNLVPTREMLDRAIGRGAGSLDHLQGVDDGESTALNAKRWKHAPFFNRIKRAVANEWHPELVYVRHDPSGNVYGVKDRVTVLRVHLLPDGKLAAWNVVQSSGIDFLDDEAIDAFRKAAPFPNPPKELVDPDGQIHFNFAFIFELSGRGSLKVFKYQ